MRPERVGLCLFERAGAVAGIEVFVDQIVSVLFSALSSALSSRPSKVRSNSSFSAPLLQDDPRHRIGKPESDRIDSVFVPMREIVAGAISDFFVGF